MRFVHCCLTLLVTLSAAVNVAHAKPIEAVKGKQYTLTRQHGPWMVMVASFRDVSEDRRQPGLSANEAAQELVYELREKGIPAYVHSQEAKIAKTDTLDRMGRPDERIFAAQRDMVCVIAGNYKSAEDPLAQKTLTYIKKLIPKFLEDEKSGAVYRLTPGRKGPLAGAFMTINPLLSPEEVARQTVDPDIVKLNYGVKYSLLECKQKWTMQVATFVGKSATPLGSSEFAGNESRFDEKLNDPNRRGINNAGEDAAQLCDALRRKGIEAYIFHDRFQSIVTVGSFDANNDPEVRQLAPQFAAKMKVDPTTQREALAAEYMIENNPKGGVPSVWAFDLQPMMIEVPRLNKK